jgi:hypothetical protein
VWHLHLPLSVRYLQDIFEKSCAYWVYSHVVMVFPVNWWYYID